MADGTCEQLQLAGPGPLAEDRFYDAPDLDKLPQWNRKRGNEWTTSYFRAQILRWVSCFMRSRAWPKRWKIEEVASDGWIGGAVQRSLFLRVYFYEASGKYAETVAQFPDGVATQDPTAIVNRTASDLDVIYATNNLRSD